MEGIHNRIKDSNPEGSILENALEKGRIRQWNLQENLHEERRLAFYNADYRRYRELNLYLGVEPEDYYAHEKGAME